MFEELTESFYYFFVSDILVGKIPVRDPPPQLAKHEKVKNRR